MHFSNRNASGLKALGGHGAKACMKNTNASNKNTQAIECLAFFPS